MKIKNLSTILLIIIFLSFHATKVTAHPADVYAQKIQVTFSQTGLQIIWEVKPGPMLSGFLWYEADTDQDGTLTTFEVDTWGKARAALLTATLDDQPLPLQIDSIKMPSDLQSFQAGEEFITFNLSASLPHPLVASSNQRLYLDNELEPQKSVDWFYLSATENTAFLTPTQKNQSITIDIVQDRALVSDQSALLTTWDSGVPSLPAGQQKDIVTSTSEQVVPALAKTSPQEILLDLVRTKNYSVPFFAFALGISLALGALHALTPGHGKTVVAAYLVGSRGTAWHAVVLGSVVTLTHTGSVFLLGIITLGASQYILPTSIIPAFEILSGLMILGLGFYLLWQRFFYWRNSALSPTLPPQIERNHPLTRAERIRASRLTPSTSTAKKKTGAISIQKVPENFHHHGDGKMHSHDVPETITWRSLITLGISGGLVPCPDAIAILLVAIAINRILLGLTLIISFSIGLAVVLIAIGLLMVSGSGLFARMDSFNKLAPFMPIASALIVLLLGFGLTYGAVARLGSSTSLSIPETSQESLESLNEAQIIYLNADENERKQLFIVNAQGDNLRKLTDTTTGIVDFAVSPDQKQVVYFEQTGEIQYNLGLMNTDGTENHIMASCKEAACGNPVWSPDSKHIIYEYMSISGDGSTTGTPSLWWFDIPSGKAQSVFQEDRLPGINPRWSPNGEWLSYATPEGIRLYHVENGENRAINNTLRAAAQWSPDSKSLLLRDVIIKNDQFVTQLFLYDLASETLTNLNANENMENILAAWSPDGKSIAVVRRDLTIPRGDQIWLMRADGSGAHIVTDAPAVLHGSLNWSPGGEYLLYDLYLLDSFPIESQLEMLNIKTGEIINLTVKGYNPQWVWHK